MLNEEYKLEYNALLDRNKLLEIVLIPELKEKAVYALNDEKLVDVINMDEWNTVEILFDAKMKTLESVLAAAIALASICWIATEKLLFAVLIEEVKLLTAPQYVLK